MSEEFKEKLATINFGMERRRKPKKTIDVHDHGTVEVTEHWEDRQDVNVKPDTIRMKIGRAE